MAISAKDVSKLRQMTGAGMMDSKKALEEANGDFDEAVTILRKKGQKISNKRADKEASEGVVFTRTNAEETEAILIALNCETDFVAKNDEFQAIGNKIVEAAMENKVADKESLLRLALDGRPVADTLTDMMGKIGEKIEVSSFEIVKGDKVVTYVHNNFKLGVLLALDGVNGNDVSELGKDITMQIASMRPVAVDKDGVDSSIIEKEIEIGKEQARQDGKPEAMLEKIAMGKLNKFYKENTLLNQQFVKDGSKTIRQLLKETGDSLTVSTFKRIAIGE